MQITQQQVIEAIQTLSSADLVEVLDFVEFIKIKRQKLSSENVEMTTSFLETANDYIGKGEGLHNLVREHLLSNPHYVA